MHIKETKHPIPLLRSIEKNLFSEQSVAPEEQVSFK